MANYYSYNTNQVQADINMDNAIKDIQNQLLNIPTDTQLGLKANQTDLDTTNANVAANTSQLADIMQNKVFLKDYPRIALETNDNGVFTRAFANIVDNTEIVFEKGKVYSVTAGLPVINNNNITITGNGATINSLTVSASTVLQFGQDTRTTLSQSVTVTQGSNQFVMSTVSGINVGDIIMFSSSAANGYSDGVYGEVKAISGTTITLNIAAHKSFTSTTQYVCSAYRNIVIRGLNINASTNQTDQVIVLYNIVNFLVEFNKLEGNNGRTGIGVHGINGKVQFNEIHGFFDQALIDNRTGYGVAISGHNIEASHNKISDCKHTLTSSDRRYYSTNIMYYRNLCLGVTDSTLTSLAAQIIDMHANTEGSIIENRIFNIVSNSGGIGMMVRSNGVKINRNVLNAVASNPSSTIKGIVFYEYAGENIEVSDNIFKGFYTYPISFESQWITTGKNIRIIGNDIEYGQIRTLFTGNPPIQNMNISDNNINTDGYINIACTVNNGRIQRNHINCANGAWEPGILLTDPASDCWIIESNDIKNNGGGGECIRFYNNGNVIKNNRLKMSTVGSPINNFNVTTMNIIVDNIVIDSVGNTSFNNKVTVSDMQITATSATNVISLTPTIQGNFMVKVYYSVSTAPTTINISVTYTDHKGSQTQQLVNVTNQGTASYLVTPIMINAKPSTPITVTATAGTANNINISASIITE